MITTAAIIGLGLMGGSFAKALTQRTGIRVYGDRTFAPPGPGEQRMYFQARKGRVKPFSGKK